MALWGNVSNFPSIFLLIRRKEMGELMSLNPEGEVHGTLLKIFYYIFQRLDIINSLTMRKKCIEQN